MSKFEITLNVTQEQALQLVDKSPKLYVHLACTNRKCPTDHSIYIEMREWALSKANDYTCNSCRTVLSLERNWIK